MTFWGNAMVLRIFVLTLLPFGPSRSEPGHEPRQERTEFRKPWGFESWSMNTGGATAIGSAVRRFVQIGGWGAEDL